MKETFGISGTLASVDVLAALCAAGRGGVSGALRVTGPAGETVRFGFEDGELVALDAPPEIAPAEVLIRAGKVQRATYEALTVGDFEDRFAVAAASGVISRRETNWGLKISAIESLSRVLSWGEGAYAFEEGPPEPSVPPLKLPVDQWVLELFLRSNDRGFVVRHIGPTDIPVARAADFGAAFARLGLTADADAVVDGIDGRRTIEQVVKRSRADEFATLKLLGALIVLGLVRPIHEMPTAPAAPAEPPAAVPAADEAAEPGVEAAEPEWSLDEAAPGAAAPPEADEGAGFAEAAEAVGGIAPEGAPGGGGERDAGTEPRFEVEEPPDEELAAAEAEPSAAEAERSDAEETEPPRLAIVPVPEVSVPLFALTAPEPEPEPESGPELDRAPEETGAANELLPGRRLGMIRAVGVLAVVALLAVVWLVRRRSSPAPVSVPGAATLRRSAGRPGAGQAPSRESVEPAPPMAAEKEPRKPEASVATPRPTAARESETAETPKRGASRGAPLPATRTERKAASPWEDLARAGRKTFERPGVHRYAIQLELACEEATLRKAFDTDPGRRRIWLAPYEFRGRSCYRVLWGKYRNLGSAKAAKATVPAMFSLDGNRPAVVPLGRAK